VAGGAQTDEPIEAGHYLVILRRNRRLIALITLGTALVALAAALLLPAVYRTTARIVLNSAADPTAPTDAASVARQLATAQRLVMTPSTLSLAAEGLPGESARSLQEKVEATADPDANIIDVTATDGEQDRVAGIANAVANAFIDEQRRITRDNVETTRAILRSRLESLGTSPETVLQRSAVAEQLAELELRDATAGLVFRLAERAERPDSSTTPAPLGVAVLGLVAGALIALLFVLGRDQLKPQVTDARELSRLIGLPVIARISAPDLDGSEEPEGVGLETETFRTLRGRIERMLDPSHKHVILVTSAIPMTGKDAVSAGLARTLAGTGRPTLLVRADTASTDLPSEDDVPGASFDVRRDGRSLRPVSPSDYVATLVDRAAETPVSSTLSILADGRCLWDPVQGLEHETVRSLTRALRTSEYTYVVVDAPAILESNDTLMLAEAADSVVVVARLADVTRPVVADARDVLREATSRPLGLLAVEAQPQGRNLAALLPAKVKRSVDQWTSGRRAEQHGSAPAEAVEDAGNTDNALAAPWWAAATVAAHGASRTAPPRAAHRARQTQASRQTGST
jgi:capsular polysaccharide biosynthesis protein